MGEILTPSALGADYKEKKARPAGRKTFRSKSHPGHSMAGDVPTIARLVAAVGLIAFWGRCAYKD